MLIKLFSKVPIYTTTRVKCLSTSVSAKNKLTPSILYLSESHSAKPYIPSIQYKIKPKISNQMVRTNTVNSKSLPKRVSMVESHSPQPYEIK